MRAPPCSTKQTKAASSSPPSNSSTTTNGRNASFSPLVCYAQTMSTVNGIWLGENLLDYTLPLFLLQLLLIILLTRAIATLLEPLHQPRYISEILGGFVLGPAVMGQVPDFAVTIFPLRSLLVMEAIGQIGLIYLIFTVGVEVEPIVVENAGVARAFAFGTICVIAPIPVGVSLGPIIHRWMPEGVNFVGFLTYLVVTLSVTALSALARVLAEQKLIGSEVGRVALAAAVLADGFSWGLLSLAVSFAQGRGSVLVGLWASASGLAFVLFCFGIVRPALMWVESLTPEGEEVDELHACGILVGVMVAGFIADAMGTHAIFGAFVFGWALPNGPMGQSLVEKVEDVVEGLLLPLFYVFSGIRANVLGITNAGAAALLVAAVVGGAFVKVAATVFLAGIYRMPLKDGVTIGILMNTKGVMELVILNIAKDKKMVGDQAYTILLILSMVMTAAVGPLRAAVDTPARQLLPYKRRTIRWHNPESELRVLACVHTQRNIPALITLLDASNPTKRAPIFVYALHLVELTGRSSAMIVANSLNTDELRRVGCSAALQAQTASIMQTLEAYEQQAGGVSIQTLTAFSPYSTMHEDVCSVVEEKHAAFILLPFHMHQTINGGLEVTHPSIRSLNRHILSTAPCTVGIIIDRGLGAAARRKFATRRIALLFFGGPDDREALAYAVRMAGSPGTTSLTVLRLVPPSREPPPPPLPASASAAQTAAHKVLTVAEAEAGAEWRADEECLKELKGRSWEGVVYAERVSRNAEDTVEAVKAMGSEHDLYIVGRGPRTESTMTAGLSEFTEFPELGTVGDFLSSSDFVGKASVLVMRQGKMRGGWPAGEGTGMMMPESPGKHVKLYVFKDPNGKP